MLQRGFFKELVPLPYGIPSADTFSRVIERINPKLIQQITLEWLNNIRKEPLIVDKQIALDGKTLKLSHDQKNNKKAAHIVNAWSDSQSLVIAQEAVHDKGNEITAMKK